MDVVRPQALFNPYTEERKRLKPAVQLKIGATVSGTACVSQSVLSPGVRIEENALVEGCVLMPGVRIGKDVRLRRVIVEVASS
jgi:glucose-1-phosphate adenylyltransferase